MCGETRHGSQKNTGTSRKQPAQSFIVDTVKGQVAVRTSSEQLVLFNPLFHGHWLSAGLLREKGGHGTDGNTAKTWIVCADGRSAIVSADGIWGEFLGVHRDWPRKVMGRFRFGRLRVETARQPSVCQCDAFLLLMEMLSVW